MRKLSHEEREDLEQILLSQGWGVLMSVIEELAKDIDERVLTYNLSEGAQGLVEEKARSEGARKLQRSITSIKEKIVKVKK